MASRRASSPLAQGKQLVHFLSGHLLGLIHAHAGRTPRRSPPRTRRRAHPHSRGENPRRTLRNLRKRGLIPAHAGKTIQFPLPPSRGRAHPHSRGENKQLLVAAASQRGSSPLMRGKRLPRPHAPVSRGLIPAHAGKTSDRHFYDRRNWAHPRSRGENPATVEMTLDIPGSSPLTRGKRPSSRPSPRCARLIPAHAGKTDGASGERDRFPAHPRSRGENGSWVSRRRAVRGSSPLTRGKQLVIDYLNRPGGLIPAHAGKTSTRGNCPSATWAHPRSRGENTGGGGLGSHDLGSSPLTRGKQYRRVLRGNVPGLIPAHAGKTYHGTRTR